MDRERAGSIDRARWRAQGRPLSRDLSGDMEFLRYQRQVFGKRCLLTYVLIDRKLASLRVHLLERYANKDRYVADYNKIRDYLNAKIGEPRFRRIGASSFPLIVAGQCEAHRPHSVHEYISSTCNRVA